MATVSGTVKDNSGAFICKCVRVFRKDTGAFVGEVYSNPTTGAWSVTVPTTATKYIAIQHDDTVDFYKSNVVLASNFNSSVADLTGKTITNSGVSISKAITAAAATGSAGTTTQSGAATATVSSTAATGSAGTVVASTATGNVTVAITGTEATAQVGSVTTQGSASVTVSAQQATGSAGVATGAAHGNANLSGVSGEAVVGSLLTAGDAIVFPLGVSAIGLAGEPIQPKKKATKPIKAYAKPETPMAIAMTTQTKTAWRSPMPESFVLTKPRSVAARRVRRTNAN